LGSVRKLLNDLKFREGEGYEEFKPGEKTAASGLSDLVKLDTGEAMATETATAATAGTAPGGFKVLWIAVGVIGFVGITGGVMLARKLRRNKPSTPVATIAHDEEPTSLPQPAVHANGNGSNGSKSFRLDLKPTAAFKGAKQNHTNGNGNGHGNGNGNGNGMNGKRRRMFNYHKFYTEMVLQGPAPVIGEPVNGYYGQDDSRLTPASASQPGGLQAHSELIGHQKSLIEEQNRLIQEQARLIEEKSKLIAEKNQLLERQSQMIDTHLV
jgi:hypothetical protein